MIPWCFAYDRQNYARYLSVYYCQVTRLPEHHPQIYEQPSDIVSISTGTTAPKDVANALLTACDQGDKAYQNFQSTRLQNPGADATNSMIVYPN